MRIFPKVLGFMAMIFVATISGVVALFNYYDLPQDVFVQKNVILAEFEYKPEEILPDTPEDTVNQSNHNAVVYELLFNGDLGLNSKKGNAVPSNVKQQGILPYLEKITQGHLKQLIDQSDGGQNLGFTLEYISDTSFYAYSYYRYGHEHNETIVAYRTLMEENTDRNLDENGDGKMDEWKASTSVKGWAKALEYEIDKQGDMQFCIDLETWTNYEGIISA